MMKETGAILRACKPRTTSQCAVYLTGTDSIHQITNLTDETLMVKISVTIEPYEKPRRFMTPLKGL